MGRRVIPPQEILQKLLRYEPETGQIYWRERPREMFPTDHHRRSWNTRYAGTPALTAVRRIDGSYKGMIFNQTHSAHRIIWKLVTGTDPDEVDHINGDRKDNRWCNLRAVNRIENSRNLSRPRHNSSGHAGVRLDKRRGKWIAKIGVAGKYKWLGHHDTMEGALAARLKAERELGFHPNHCQRETICPEPPRIRALKEDTTNG